MLSLDTLKLSNFITYEDQIFDFNELFDKENILLIYGKNIDDMSFADNNGAGKSIIYEALLFLLCNRTTKNSNKNSLIGVFKKSMNVEGTFTDSSNNHFWIKRYRKDKIYSNDIRLKINGKEKKKSTATDLSKHMLDILGFSYKRIMNTSVFESNDERSRFVYLGDKEGKQLLSQMKGLEIFLKCEEVVKEEMKEITKELAAIKNEIEKLITLSKRISEERKENETLGKEFNQNIKERLKILIRKKSKTKKKFLIEKKKKEKELKEDTIRIRKLKLSIKKVSKFSMEDKRDKINERNEYIVSLEKQIAVTRSVVNSERSIIEEAKINDKKSGIGMHSLWKFNY